MVGLTPKYISKDAMLDHIKGNDPTGIAISLLGTWEVVAESEGAQCQVVAQPVLNTSNKS